MWWFKLLGLSLLLMSCGFQPRGVVGLAAQYQPLGLAADPYAPLVVTLRQQLAAGGVQLSDDLAQVQALLRLLDERFERRVLTVSGAGKVLEFELVYQLRYEVISAQGVTLIPAQTLNLRREYLNQADNVLGVADEEATLRTEMQRDLAQQVLRQLTAQLR
jgi:LPS-assembly lipoprotein